MGGTDFPGQIADIINSRTRVLGIHNSSINGRRVGGLGEVPVPDNLLGISLKYRVGQKILPFFFAKTADQMMSKQLQNIIGIRAMDKLVIIMMRLTNNPGSHSHRNKGSNSK